ncbi:MAG: hypothetical protein Q9183_003755 [Haloplaca sp. 2 TL-2023]
MTWNRLRGGQSDRRKRHSTLNLNRADGYGNEHIDSKVGSGEPVSLHPDETSRSVSDLVNHDHELHTSVSQGQDPSTYLQEPQIRPQRFSLLKFRHASDSQLSRTARSQAMTEQPPMPVAPSIVTTAPTMDPLDAAQKRKSTFLFSRRQKPPDAHPTISAKPSNLSLRDNRTGFGSDSATFPSNNPSARASRITFDEPERQKPSVAPPAYGDDAHSSLALPVSRLSESSRSDGSSGSHGVYATTTTTHTVSTTTTFFRLPRRKKNKGPLFPLPVKIPQPGSSPEKTLTPRPSDSRRMSESPHRLSSSQQSPLITRSRSFLGKPQSGQSSPSRIPPALNFAAPGIPTLRRDSTQSTRSGRSSPILAAARLSKRGRTTTKGSFQGNVDDGSLPTPPLPQSTRTSTSTGRASLGGLFNLSRLRQNSEPSQQRHGSSHAGMPGTPISGGSKSQSFNLTREAAIVPQRQDGETAAKYLLRLEEAVTRGAAAAILSKSDDEFSKNVLRSYMRRFKFFGDPLDMSIRKLLMDAELPKETQQIDRMLQAFANRYHECNPGIYASPDEAYFIAFSLLILHTDVFNKNNKHKMQKSDYTKNARGTGVADEVLECFYDNISYTPFIHVEDDVGINGERIVALNSRKHPLSRGSTDVIRKKSSEPVDPYTLLFDNNLDPLRPSLKEVLELDDPYSYLGTMQSLNLADLNKTFFRTGVLQIVSSRSRPEAFMSPETTTNPAEAHPGVVDIKITKVGMLWRKDTKKKKARSPWQEWGAILTGSQLYFFRNTSWVRSLMHQCSSHHKHGLAGSACVFKPPLEAFKPDALVSTEDAVALLDSTYKKHKHALVFIRHGGFEETLLAENEAEMNDWLAKLNYAATFRTAGVRMRGLLGGQYDGQQSRPIRRMDSDKTSQSIQSPTGEVTISGGTVDGLLSQQIQEARRQIMVHKISEAEEKLNTAYKQLDVHLRNARHLQILAPIQDRSRQQLVLAAGAIAAKVKWVRMEMWRIRCHKDILVLDLEEEVGDMEARRYKSEVSPRPTMLGTAPSQYSVSRSGSTVEDMGTPQTRPLSDSTIRPSTQTSPAKAPPSDDVLLPGEKHPLVPVKQGRQSSWEIVPLTLEPAKGPIRSDVSVVGPGSDRSTTSPQQSPRHDSKKLDIAPDLAARLVTPTPSLDEDEQKVLIEAGLLRSETPTPGAKRQDTATTAGSSDLMPDSQGKGKSAETSTGESRPKLRRSLQRTLREAHVSSHHRGRKGKDSASSAGMSEDNPPVVEKEGLARGTGSFTVHGKKASVIKFGSEWQNMSPEERLKVRKQFHGDEAKMIAVEDEEPSTLLVVESGSRPTSTRSVSTTASMQRPASASRTISSSRASTQ